MFWSESHIGDVSRIGRYVVVTLRVLSLAKNAAAERRVGHVSESRVVIDLVIRTKVTLRTGHDRGRRDVDEAVLPSPTDKARRESTVLFAIAPEAGVCYHFAAPRRFLSCSASATPPNHHFRRRMRRAQTVQESRSLDSTNAFVQRFRRRASRQIARCATSHPATSPRQNNGAIERQFWRRI